jgi:hypothetical protein
MLTRPATTLTATLVAASVACTSPKAEPVLATGAAPDTADLGGDTGSADADGCPILPSENWWNQDVRSLPEHADSAAWIDSIGAHTPLLPYFGADLGVVVNRVQPDTPWVAVNVYFEQNSDPNSYPLDARFAFEEASGFHAQDRLVAIDLDDCMLYELFGGVHEADGSWSAVQALRHDLRSNELHEEGWRSSTASDAPGPVHDGSGMPLYPGLVRHDEASTGHIDHALRLRLPRSRRAYLPPASWAASQYSSPDYPPMGARFRLHANVDCGAMPTQAAAICRALQKHGMILGENGDEFGLEGELDANWAPAALQALATLTAGDFIALETGEIRAY